jgi:hypothetical protein
MSVSLALVATAFALPVVGPANATAACQPTTGTFTDSGKLYEHHTFSTVGECEFEIPEDATEITSMLVGGGGGGGGGGSTSAGRGGGGGGGAGAAIFYQPVSSGVVRILVGAGGIAGLGGFNNAASAVEGGEGGDTAILSGSTTVHVARGGGGGGAGSNTGGKGGDSWDASPEPQAVTGVAHSGLVGAHGAGRANAGATTNQSTAFLVPTAGSQISGFPVIGTNSNVIYSRGGAGASQDAFGQSSSSLAEGAGGRGGRGSLNLTPENYGYSGEAGKPGLVIIRYVIPQSAPQSPGDSSSAPTPTVSPLPQGGESAANRVNVGQSVSVSGLNLSGITLALIANRVISVLMSTPTGFTFKVPRLKPGWHTLQIFTATGFVTVERYLEVVDPKASTFAVPGFAINSPVLTEAMKKRIRTILARNTEASTIEITGVTGGPVRASDRKLALDRARAARAFIRSINPDVKFSKLKTRTESRTVATLRQVVIRVTSAK